MSRNDLDRITIEPRYTLDEAAKRFFPGGVITKRSLYTEKKRGRLRVEEIAGKFFVTESAILEMCAACEVPRPDQEQPCPALGSRPGCTSDIVPGDLPSGSFSTDRKKLARAQAQMSLSALRSPSGPTAQKDTSHRVVPLKGGNSSSMR